MIRERDFMDNAGGLIENQPRFRVPAGFTPDALNVDIDVDGRVWLPRMGVNRYISSAIAPYPIRGEWYLVRPDGTWAHLVCCNSTLYSILADKTWVEIGALYGPEYVQRSGQVWSGRLFICSGYGPPQVYQTKLEDLNEIEGASLPPAWKTGNWPSTITLINAGRNERLLALGLRRDPSRAYVCALFNWKEWTDLDDSDDDEDVAFDFAVAEDDGEPLVGVSSLAGLLVCGKKSRTIIYTSVSPLTGPVGMRPLGFGMANQDSIIAKGNIVMWPSSEGFVILQAALEPGAEARGTLSATRIPLSLKEISPTRLRQAVGIWDEKFKRARWIMPTRESARNHKVFDYYPFHRRRDGQGLTEGAWMVSDGIEASCLLSYDSAGGPVILAGDYSGYVNRLNDGWTDFGGDIPSHYSLPRIFGPGRRVLVNRAELYFESGGQFVQAEHSVDDGDAKVLLPQALAPSFTGEHQAVRRPEGAGSDHLITLRHLGGGTPAVFEGAHLELDVVKS